MDAPLLYHRCDFVFWRTDSGKHPFVVLCRSSDERIEFWEEDCYRITSYSATIDAPISLLEACTKEEAVQCLVERWGKTLVGANHEIEEAFALAQSFEEEANHATI